MVVVAAVANITNNKQINIYESETFNIFKTIDKNTKKVVTPKIQMDQLVEQISVSSLAQTKDIKSNNPIKLTTSCKLPKIFTLKEIKKILR